MEFENLFPRPTATAQFWVVRYYVMNGVGQIDPEQHPHCHWPTGAIEIVHTLMEIETGGNGNWYHGSGWGNGGYNAGQTGEGGPNFPWFPMVGPTTQRSDRRVLRAGTWYRYEYIIHWMNDTQYRVYPRLYDMAGTLLNDFTTWRHSDGAGTMQDYYANGGFFRRSRLSPNPDNIRTLSFGMGQSGVNSGYYYVADAAFKLGTGITDYIGQ